MRWRKTQGFDLVDEGRDVAGSASSHGDELPLVTSSHPRLASPTQVSSSPASPMSLPSTPLTAVSTTTIDEVPSPLTATATNPRKEFPGAKSPSASQSTSKLDLMAPPQVTSKSSALDTTPSSPPLKSPVPSPTRYVSAVPLTGMNDSSSSLNANIRVTSSPQSKVSSPQHAHPVTPQRTPVSPQRTPTISPQRTPVVSPPVTPQRTPTSPTSTPSRPSSTVTISSTSRPTSQSTPVTPALSAKGVVVVVNGGGSSSADRLSQILDSSQVRSPRDSITTTTTTTTIPIGDLDLTPTNNNGPVKSSDKDPPSTILQRKKTNTTPRKSHTKSNSTSGEPTSKRNTHEKSKSVTIVVNDQHVTYSNTPNTYTTTTTIQHHPTTNGFTNGDLHKGTTTVNGEMVTVNGHTTVGGYKGDLGGDGTRPSSAASIHGSSKVDPDIQVRPLVGWWGEGVIPGTATGSVLEDTVSSDDCHRSTLTLVQSPARTLSRAVSIILYLSGEAGSTVGEDTGEAWSSVISALCGVVLILGAAALLRLPRLIYEHGAGNFLAAWCGVVIVLAAPLAYLEAGLSQFSSSAALAVWRLVPIARGVGWSTMVVCFYWAVVVLGYTAPLVHYLLVGIDPRALEDVISAQCSESLYNNYTTTGHWAVDYYRVCVYDLPDRWSSGLELTFSWPLPVGVATVAVFATIISACGTRVFAGMTFSTALLAVLGLCLQFTMGLTELYRRDIPSLWEIARPFLIPQGERLLEPRVWCAAVAHVLISLGLGIGLLMNFSARGAFRFTLRRHLWGLIVLLSVVTALVSAVTVLQLTLLADDRGLPVRQALVTMTDTEYNDTFSLDVAFREDVGVGVGTVVITTSHLLQVLSFPFKWLQQIVSTVIFFGLWCGGVTTVSVCLHALVAVLRDVRDCFPRPAAALLLSPLLVAAAMATTPTGGAAVVALIDGSVLSPVVLWPPLTLSIAVTAVYGIHKVRKDFTFMLESTVNWLWAPIWGLFIPLSLLGVIVWACVMDGRQIIVADGPIWRMAVVWGLRAVVLLPVPITAIYVVKSQLAYGVWDKVASSLQSSREWGDWGPQDPIEHHNWRRWREDETRPITSLKRRFANRPLTYTHSTLSSESSSTLTRLRNKYQKNGTASIL